MELLQGLLGLYMLYATGHFLVIQNNKAWEQRTSYERIVTVVAIATIVLVYLALIIE